MMSLNSCTRCQIGWGDQIETPVGRSCAQRKEGVRLIQLNVPKGMREIHGSSVEKMRRSGKELRIKSLVCGELAKNLGMHREKQMIDYCTVSTFTVQIFTPMIYHQHQLLRLVCSRPLQSFLYPQSPRLPSARYSLPH